MKGDHEYAAAVALACRDALPGFGVVNGDVGRDTADRDALRTAMSVTTSEMSSDQMVILFTDVTAGGGVFTIWWDDQMASTPFSLAR